jgi:hypothetical protein
MPYKSKAQQRKFFAMEARGELPKGTARQWAHHTPDIKALPERVASPEPTKEAAVSAVTIVGVLLGTASWPYGDRRQTGLDKLAGDTPTQAARMPTPPVIQKCGWVDSILGPSPDRAVNAFTAKTIKSAALRAVNAFTARLPTIPVNAVTAWPDDMAVKQSTEAIHRPSPSILDGIDSVPADATGDTAGPDPVAVYRVKAGRLMAGAVNHATPPKSVYHAGPQSWAKLAAVIFQGPQSHTVPAAQAQAALQAGIRPTPGVLAASTLQPQQAPGGAGGANPQSHPIQSFSGLGTNPNSLSSYNGNAAFGTHNNNV